MKPATAKGEKKTRRHDEDFLQRQCEEFLLLRKIPYLHLRTRISYIRNGRWLHLPVEGNKGWPDLIVFVGRGKVLLVELKSATGAKSREQRQVFAELEASGYAVLIIRTLEDFMVLVDGVREKRRKK